MPATRPAATSQNRLWSQPESEVGTGRRGSWGAHISGPVGAVLSPLLMGDKCGAHTVPYIEVKNPSAQIEHEATTSKISEDQLFYLMSRGLTEDEAMAMIVRGFVEPIAKELPMEYALELNRLIELQMEGAVG